MRKSLLVLFMFVFVLGAWAQERVISGKVTSSDDGSPLPGVNVVLKGTSTGTVTDSGGGYKLSVPASGGTLQFSFIGMEPREEEIGERSVIDLPMASDVKQLSEVVVTALGVKVDKDKFNAAVASVSGSTVLRSGETSALTGLSAKAAGVLITRTGGDPGAGAYIQIRGQNTISSNAQPLFIIDGMPVSNSSDGVNNIVVQQSRLNDLNPDDIASIDVLKGASAATLWGTRAANGVVIITTKKGRDEGGKVNISWKTTVSIDEINKMHDLQRNYGGGRGGQWRQNARESWGDRIDDRTGGTDAFITAPGPGYNGFATFADGTKRYAIASGTTFSVNGRGAGAHGGKNSKETYDHRYDAFQTGRFVDNNLTISGGNAKSNFYASVSNLDQTGIVKSFSDYKKTSVRFNMENRFTNWFKVSANANYISMAATRYQQGDNLDGLLLGGLRTSPDFDNQIYEADYTTIAGATIPDRQVSYRSQLGQFANPRYSNPIWNIKNNKSNSDVDRILGNLELTIDPTDWMSVVGRVGIDNFVDTRNDLWPLYSASYPEGYLQKWWIQEKQFQGDLFAKFTKEFSSKFSATAIVGVQYNNRKYEWVFADVKSFTLPGAPDQLANGLNSNLTASNFTRLIRTYGYYAQIDLAALDMFYITLTGRNESASTFGSGIDNSFFFPSAAVAWQFTKLEALKDNSVLSFGKFRANYGEVGIQPDAYRTSTLFVPSAYGDGYAGTLQASSSVYGGGFNRSAFRGNPKLGPERKKEVEVGLDLRFLKDRFSLSVTGYNNTTTDVIIPLSLPDEVGFSQEWTNAAELNNKGLEIDLGAQILTGAFKWSMNGNWAANRNTVVSLAGSEAQYIDGTYGGASYQEGQPFGVILGTDFLKDEVPTSATFGKYLLDADGFPQDGTTNEIIGNMNPDWMAGLGNTFSYKGVSLFVMFSTVYGNDIFNGTRGALYTFGTHADTGNEVTSSVALKAYDGTTIPAGTPFRGQIKDFGAGPVALTQAWYQGPGTSFNQASVKQFIEDGTATRLREITLGYSLSSPGFRNATKLRSIDFSLTGRNLILWTNYTGIDPESSISGTGLSRGDDWFASPNTKSFLFSVKINF